MPINNDEVIEYVTVNGEKVPKIVVPATITITHKLTGKEYASDEEAQADVDDPGTPTQQEDIQRDVMIEVARIKDMLSKGGL
tara:strand:- start:2221 stop:2466 length:246 start_codon:yes stop_codon:yes gene_type:complete